MPVSGRVSPQEPVGNKRALHDFEVEQVAAHSNLPRAAIKWISRKSKLRSSSEVNLEKKIALETKRFELFLRSFETSQDVCLIM